MNYVKLSQEFEKIVCSINNEKLNAFNDISALLNADLPMFINNILIELDDEINDEYSVIFEGQKIIFDLLQSKMTSSHYCKEITLKEIKLDVINKKYYELLKLSVKYLGEDNNYFIRKSVCNEIDIPLPENYVNGENSEIIISNSVNENYHYNIQIGDSISIKKEKVLIFIVPKNSILDVLEYCTCLKIKKFIEEMKLELNECELIEKDKKLFDFFSFPKDHFKISFSQGLSVLNNTYKGLVEGDLFINVVDDKNNVYITKNIKCVKHNYLTEIRILTNLSDLTKHQRKKLDVIYIPDNADDINDVKYEIVNPQIAMVNDHQEIVPLQTGKTILHIKGKNVSAQADIQVRNEVGFFEFEQQSYILAPGETKIVSLKLLGEDLKTEQLQWYFDNPNIAQMIPSVKHDCCKLVASQELQGVGNIRCFNPVTQTNKYCSIKVERPQKAPISWIIIVIILLLLICCCSGVSS